MTRAEAMSISGLTANKRPRLRQLAAWFRERGVGRVFITLGQQGVFFADDDGAAHVDAPKNRAVNAVTGAGDAFLAGIVAGWLDGMDSVSSAALGQSLAAASLAARSAVPAALSTGVAVSTR